MRRAHSWGWLGCGLVIVLVLGLAVGIGTGLKGLPSDRVAQVPSLTVWGKIFSLLLLAAMGVAYLVWRRPVLQAQAILETSPLGAGHQAAPMVDWGLYLKTLVVVEMLAVVGIVIAGPAGLPLTALDVLGVLGSGAIVALVVHLLILARGGHGRSE